MWGGHAMPMSDCAVLERAYQPVGQNVATAGSTVGTIDQDVDGDPSTSSSSTGTGTGTGTGGSSLPTTGPNPAAPDTAPDSSTNPDSQSCFSTGWSWNPVSWVYVPIKCSFIWAFVPTPDATATMSDIGTNIGSRAPFTYVGDVDTWVNGLTAGAGSTGCWTLDVPLGSFIGDVPVFDTCSGIGAMMEAHRTLMSIALYAGLVVPMLWWAWRQYAPGATGTA
jgi:hypothetical protein